MGPCHGPFPVRIYGIRRSHILLQLAILMSQVIDFTAEEYSSVKRRPEKKQWQRKSLLECLLLLYFTSKTIHCFSTLVFIISDERGQGFLLELRTPCSSQRR